MESGILQNGKVALFSFVVIEDEKGIIKISNPQIEGMQLSVDFFKLAIDKVKEIQSTYNATSNARKNKN